MKMDVWHINGHTVEYIDKTHTYIVDGVITPSVTQIIKCVFPDKYAGVSEYMLKSAGRKGTALHGVIEEYENNGLEDSLKHKIFKLGYLIPEFKNYLFLKKKYGFIPLENEVPIVYEYKGKVVFVGRLDQVALYQNKLTIIDIKRTHTLDLMYLKMQENLYRLGYQQSYKKDIQQLHALYLRNEDRAFKQIPIDEELALKVIENYLEKRGQNE